MPGSTSNLSIDEQ
jgi:hypothetical protein